MKEPSGGGKEKGATRILVVDDNPANLDVMTGVLEPEGYDLAVATSGEQALKVADRFRPDLILLDVMLPGMDGYETCRKLKETPEISAIPVIFVTARRETEAIVKGFRCGGQDYIAKPFRREEVLARVRTHARMRRMVREQERLIERLRESLAQVRTLRGLLPICAACKKIRDDEGYWHQIEAYIQAHTDVDFSHGVCHDCACRLYPDYFKKE